MMHGNRSQVLWWSALVHRVTGLLLAVFLPIHFLALGLAIEGEEVLDQALDWTDQPFVKVAEVGLVFLLAVHLAGGVRILVLEGFAWLDWQKAFAGTAVGLSAMAALLFALRVF